MEKWFSGSEFVAARDARRCSGFVRTVIEASAIAARRAVATPGASNAVPPTAGTSRAPKAGWIIATGNVRTESAMVGLA
jgi:hypothetical protein